MQNILFRVIIGYESRSSTKLANCHPIFSNLCFVARRLYLANPLPCDIYSFSYASTILLPHRLLKNIRKTCIAYKPQKPLTSCSQTSQKKKVRRYLVRREMMHFQKM